jgi:hypothetical protein
MATESIDDILKRKAAEKSATAPAADSNPDAKFFSILVGDGDQENFLEIQTRDGLRSCFPYANVIWMVYDPDDGLSIEIGGFLVHIKGRGLVPDLFKGLKQKRVAWVKEADHELQDNKSTEIFISEITIEPPKGFNEEETSEAPVV